MPKRKEEFIVGEYYHVFNRGTEKRKIFLDKGDLKYFFDAMQIANKKSNIKNTVGKDKRKKEKEKSKQENNLVEIISYCLVPNHFHFILKEIEVGGISKFIGKLNGSYSQYFNKKHERSGSLFQGPFKANRLTGKDKQEFSLELTSAYVNLNYKHHNYDIKKDFIKTSVFEYLGEEKGELICNQKEIKKIINNIGGLKKYKEWLKGQSKYFSDRHNLDSNSINFDELES